MKKIIQFTFLFILCGVALAKLDRIIAIVNDEVITQSELDRRMDALKMVGKSSKKEALDALIDDSIKLQLAKKVKLIVDDNMVNNSIREIAEGNHATVDQLYSYIEQQGFSKEGYKEMIRKQMTIARVMQQQFGSRVHITKADVLKYQAKLATQEARQATVDEYQVMNILVPLPESAQATDIQAAKLQAERISEELQNGKSLEQIAQQYPVAEQHDLGWRKGNELPELFLAQLEKMKLNEISKPFQAPNGFQILMLNGKRVDASAAQQQEVTLKHAEQALYQQKLTEAAKPWLEKAKKESFIKIM